MTPLGLLKTEVSEKLMFVLRTLLPQEITDLEHEILVASDRPREIIIFPLPLPSWVGARKTANHVVRTWAWEREGSLIFLVDPPEECQGDNLVGKMPYLNSRADVAGRFYLAPDKRTYYINSQTIFCGDDVGNGRPVSLLTAKAAREAAKHLIMYCLAGVVKDLSLTLHLTSNHLGGSFE